MKNLIVLFLITSAILFSGCSHSVENTILCVPLDPLEKVFTEESYFVENPDTAAVARGETATFQFVIKSVYPIQCLKVEAGDLSNGNRQITATLKAFVGYIRAGSHAGFFGPASKDAVFPVSDLYPDCLQEVECIDVASMQNQPVWIDYTVPRDAASGDYSATLVFTGKVNGKQFRITKEVKAKVYPVTLPEQTLWVTNWFTLDELSKMNGDQPVEQYSDRYWELLTALAHVMRDHGQNTYLINPVRFCEIECTDLQYSFDFTNFDKIVDLFIREGGLKRLEGGHLGFGMNIPEVGRRPFDNDTTQIFLSQYFSALYSHLIQKGWSKMYVQHIADEPSDENVPMYVRIAEFVNKLMPGIPIIDAINSPKLSSSVNIWVPQLDVYHKNYAFYEERQKAGDEVWFYTCCNPQGNYANRYLELPLVQTRFLHWINCRYGATGYLHWGLNYWQSKTNDASVKIPNPGYTGHHSWPGWPAGDSWIVYPAEGKVYSSIRFKAMRDGIADYELLKLLEQKAPDKAKELTGKVIINFTNYNNNIRAFRLTRLELLKALSE